METETIMVEEVLRHLIEICHDDQCGFGTAAESVSNSALKAEFFHYSGQFGQFIADLERELRNLGQTPPTHGTVVGALRRGWMHLATVITGSDEVAILSAILKAEQAAVDTYASALDAPMPDAVQEMLSAQYSHIVGIRNHIQTLCDRVSTD